MKLVYKLVQFLYVSNPVSPLGISQDDGFEPRSKRISRQTCYPLSYHEGGNESSGHQQAIRRRNL